MASLSDYIQRYNELVSINGGTPVGAQAPQQAPMAQLPQFNGNNQHQIENALQRSQAELSALQEQSAPQYRQMNDLEKGLTGIREFGAGVLQGANELTGFNPEDGFTFENVLRMAPTLPAQMLSGITEGLSQGYEFVGGKNILEGADLESGTVMDYDLDTNQRAASGLNALINVGGLATGGSGRVIGTLGKLGTGGKAFGRMARGSFASEAATGVGKFVGQTAYDVAEEAGEEFVQAYLEDARYKINDGKTFERAIESAKWGAAGGGMMSGTMQGVNAAYDNFKQKVASSNNNAQSGQVSNQGLNKHADDYNEMRALQGDLRFMPNTNEEIAESLQNKTRIDGSGSATNVYTDPRLDLDDYLIGDQEVIATWNRSEKDQKIVEEKLLGIDHATAVAAMIPDDNGKYRAMDNTYNTPAEALEALREGRKLKTVLGRNPDTKNGGFYANVAGFFHGSGLHLNSGVMSIVGADFDADKSQYYFDIDDLNVTGWAHDLLVSSEGYRSNLDWAFILGDKFNKTNVSKFIKATTSQYGQDISDQAVSGIEQAAEQYENKEKTWQYTLSSTLTQMQKEINSIADGEGTAILNGFISEFKGADDTIITNLANNAINTAANYVLADLDMDQTILPAKGKLNARARITQVYKAIGLNPFQLGTEGNVIFRQYGQVYYAAHDLNAFRDRALAVASAIEGHEDAISAVIRASLRMEASGVSPSATVEGMIDSMVVARTMQAVIKERPDFKLETSKDFELLLDKYIEVYNEYVSVFNNANKNLTARGFVLPSNGKYKNELEGADDPQAMRSFFKSFGSFPMEELFRDVPESLDGKTLRESVEIYIKDGTKAMLDFADKPGLQRFFNRLVGAASTEKAVVSDSLKKRIADFDTKHILDAYRKNNGELSISMQMEVGSYLDGLNMILSPKIGLRAGLRGPDILDNKIGEMLFSENKETRWRAIVAIAMENNFKPIVDGLNSDDELMNLRAYYALEQIVQVSPVHAVIGQQLIENGGHSKLLDVMTDVDMSWTELEYQAGFVLGDTEYDLFLDSIKSESSDFDLSGITDRLKKAENSLSRAVKLRFENERKDIGIVKNLVKMNKRGTDFVAWFYDAVSTRKTQFDTSNLGAQLWAAQVFSHEGVEKGVIQTAAHQGAVANQLVQNGRQLSFLDSFLIEPFGQVRIDTFWSSPYYLLNCLADKNVSYTITDEYGGDIQYATINRDVIFASVSPGYNPDEGPNANDILALLKEHPQISGWLCRQQPQYTEAGGEAGVSNAKVESMKDSFTQFISDIDGQEGRDTQMERRVREDKIKLENWLLNQSGYKGYLARCSSQKIKNSLYTPADAQRIMQKVHEDAVNGFYNAVMTGGDRNESTALNELLRVFETDTRSKVISDVHSLIGAAQQIMSLKDATAESNFKQAMRHNLADLWAIREAKKIGIDVSGISAASSNILGDISKAIRNDLEECVDISIELSAIMLRMYGENLDSTFIPSANILSALEEQADIQGINKDTLRSAVLNRFSSRFNRIASIKMPTFFDPEVTINTKDEFIKLCSTIAEESGVIPGENEIEKDWETFQKGGGKQQSIIAKWNGIVMQAIADRSNARLGTFLNGNMLNASDKTIGQVKQWIDAIRLDSNIGIASGSDITRTGEQAQIPIPSFADSEIEAIVNQLQLLDNAGYGEMRVALNGGVTKHLSGLGYLPKFIMPTVPPIEMKVQKVIEEAEKVDAKNKNWHYLLSMPNKNTSADDLRVIGSSISELKQLPPDTPIFVYNPEYSPHGLDSAFVPASPIFGGKEYHRGSRLLLDINAYAQEGMVLKAKKTLEGATEYLADRHKKYAGSNIVNIGQDIQDSMASALRSYRNNMANLFLEDFRDKGRLEKLGKYSHEECLILAQMCTPGVEVTLVSGDQKIVRLLDASYIFNSPETFAKELSRITENGAFVIESARIPAFSPTTLSYKINKAVSDVFHEGDNIKDVRDAANKAANDWSDLNCQALSINTILSGCSHIGNAFKANPRSEGSRTAMQYFLMHEFGENSLIARSNVYTPYPSIDTDGVNAMEAKVSLSDKTFGVPSGRSAGIVQVFYSENNESVEESYAGKNYRIINSGGFNYSWSPKHDFKGILLDYDQIENAIEWSRKTGAAVLVPKEIKDKISSSQYKHGIIDGASAELTIAGNVETFYKVNFLKAATDNYSLAGVLSDKASILLPDEIRATFVDLDQTYQLGDAVYVADPSAGVLFVDGFGVKPIGNIKELFTSKLGGKYRVATSDEIASLKSDFNDGDLSRLDFSSAGRISVDRQRQMLNTFFKSLDVDSNMRQRNVESGEIITFIADGNGTTFAPVILPSTAPAVAGSVRFELSGTRALIGWTGRGGIGVDNSMVEFVKNSLDGESFKGILTVLQDGRRLPRLATSNDEYCAYAISGEAEASRVHGMDKQLLVNTLHYQALKYNMSIMFEKVNDKYYWNKHILSQNIEEGTLNDLINNERSAWEQVRNGRITFTEDDHVNGIIQNLVRKAFLYNQDPRLIFSSYKITEDNKSVRTNRDNYYHLYFDDLSEVDLFRFFSYFKGETNGHPLCVKADDFDPNANFDVKPLVDIYGRTLCEVDNKWDYYPVRWGNPKVIGEVSNMTLPSGSATWSWQHVYSRGLENGYLDDEIHKMIEYSDYLLGVNEYYNFNKLPTPPDTYIKNDIDFGQRISELGQRILSMPGVGFSEAKVRDQVYKRSKHLGYVRRVREDDGFVSDPANHPKIKRAVSRLNAALKFDSGKELTYEQVSIEAARLSGFTYNENGSDINNSVAIDTLVKDIDTMVELVLNSDIKLPIANKIKGGSTIEGRYALPMLLDQEVDWWWNSEVIRKNWGTPEAFKDAIKHEADDALNQLKYIPYKERSKRYALELAFTYDYLQNGYTAKTERIWGTTFKEDIVKADAEFINAFVKGDQAAGLSIDKDRFIQLATQQEEMLTDMANYSLFGNTTKTDKDGNPIILTKDGKTVDEILENATQLSKIMALPNPGVFISNIMDRGVHQGIMNYSMRIGHELPVKVGPYSGKAWINQNIVRQAVNDPFFIELYSAYRMSQFTGDERAFIAGMNSAEDLRAWLDQRKENMTPFQRSVERIYGIFTGGNKFLKNQMTNFINRFVMFCEQDPDQAAIWLEDVTDGDGNKRPRIEADLDANPAGWFLEVMGATTRRTPSLITAMQAMNSAKQGDMAQRNALVMLFQYVTKDTPLSKFFVTTTVMRFPEYTMNVTGRMLNWLLPMSTINYVFTENLAKWGAKQGQKDGKFDPHFETAQVHASLREAMLVDITHLGVGAVAMILVSMSGGIEPPEDEHKWGNPDEWTVCGLRVGEAWWIEDILGIALPMACFTRSAQLGNPRYDLLFNGINQACYNNPIIKISDAAGFLVEPEGRFVTDFEDDVIAYEKAKGGPPSYTDWLLGNGMNFGLSWISQFFTPSIVREFYNNMQQWESSYKRIYKETPTGKLSQDGEDGETELTTYMDAMVRRATRRNPVLGFLMNIATGGQSTTGYMAHEMPDVIYYDDAQIASMEEWSIDGLSDQEAQAKILEIITLMQSYDDMDALRATGFYLDGKTKAALSSVVWDTIYEFDDFIEGLKAQGKNDYYYLGNGDWKTGQMIWAQLNQAVDEQKQAWTNFYYDKVRSSALSEPLVTYKRYNTNYAQDDQGNFYATGFRPTGVLPFVGAPGTLTNPEGTAGYENDWVTVSAVTGQPMEGQRALVPIKGDLEDWPDLEYWAGNENGTGHSALYKQWYGSGGDGTLRGESAGGLSSLGDLELPEGLDLTRNPDETDSGYPRYPRSGGGYSRRSGGGGGGGGSAPNIYSRVNAPNISNPDTMRGARIYDANYDAIRPNFETKGSREAYKRSDI